MIIDDQTMLSRKEAAAFLRQRGCPISHNTLATYASNNNSGGGPSFYKNGHRTLYKPVDLEVWRKNRLRKVE